MREIIFRAWLPELKKMVCPKAIWFLDRRIAIEYENEKGERCIDSDNFFELMQFTGLTDKNGTRIFEGDIVRYAYSNFIVFYDGKTCVFKMKMIYGGEFYAQLLEWEANQYEVIGNIHENPELLKEAKR